MTEVEEAEVTVLMAKIESLRVTSELSGIQLMSTFIGRRIQPLQNRPHGMWEYSGARDVSRVGAAELSNEETEKKVRPLTLLSSKDKPAFFPPIAPFSKDNPLPDVSATRIYFPSSALSSLRLLCLLLKSRLFFLFAEPCCFPPIPPSSGSRGSQRRCC